MLSFITQGKVFHQVSPNPSAGESSSDRNSSYHDLKVHISYVCIYCEYFHPQCGRGKEKGSIPKPKLLPVSPMTAEKTGDRCQTCQKDEINHHSFEFNTQKFGQLIYSLYFCFHNSFVVLSLKSVVCNY